MLLLNDTGALKQQYSLNNYVLPQTSFSLSKNVCISSFIGKNIYVQYLHICDWPILANRYIGQAPSLTFGWNKVERCG